MSTVDEKINVKELPFVAPCRKLKMSAPLNWLKLGWADIKKAPWQSLSYGSAIVILCCIVSFMVWLYGGIGLLVSLLSGFLFLGPILALGLYSISCQIQAGMTPRLGYCLREGKRHLGNELIFAVILSVILLIWARAATMTHILYPETSNAVWTQFIPFFTVGTLEGVVFSAIIFCFSAFSLPMIMDRKVDVVTAVITSINAVLRNRRVSLIWACIIALIVAIGFATLFLGFIVLMPLVGHATWHAYKETIISDEWPKHGAIID
ncbi:MAG: DUF2189 domain-containing protein [Gammaproteobacteria bacterium]|nr:DUF2189 domain-containing protein [Gammaproteobacteria bacterium]